MITAKETERLICEMWNTHTVSAIARHLSTSRNTVAAIGLKHGLPPKQKSKQEILERNQIVCEMWLVGDRVVDIASALSIDPATVIDAVTKAGLPLRGKECKPKWNTSFFERRDDRLTAYWAGFLYADGCVCGNSLSLEIGVKDYPHLQKFVEAIAAPSHYAKKTEVKVDSRHPSGYRCSVGLSYFRMQEILLYWGIAPRKTYKWQEPQCSTIDELQGFLVGLIDGDGHINKSKGEISVAVSGFTPELVDWIIESLKSLDYDGYMRCYSQSKNCYHLVLATARNELKWLLRTLEPWKYPYLERKWNRLIDVLQKPPSRYCKPLPW